MKRGSIFNSIRMKAPQRNAFNLSYENKLSLNMGELMPFYVQEVFPNDSFKVGNEYLMRTQPLLAPMMHRVDVYQHYFFVPMRLIWDNFEKFITGGEDGLQMANPPYLNARQIVDKIRTNIKARKLLDALGYPTDIPDDITSPIDANDDKFLSLRIRAYNLIYNEYFRDQNTQDPVAISKGDDFETDLNVEILNRCWRHDYFTSALPFAQRGPQVSVPWSGGVVTLDPNGGYQRVVNSNGEVSSEVFGDTLKVSAGGPTTASLTTDEETVLLDPHGTLKVDAIDIDINDLRRTNVIQKWFEKNARAGGRYVEQIASMFGVHPKDYRLDRPEYLGGGRQPLNISEVVQTSSTDADSLDTITPQGNLAGKGIASNSQYVFKQKFDEHGIVIGLISIMPKTSYQQGVSAHLSKFDKFDWLQPMFANIGEQEIKSKELYFDFHNSAKDDNNSTFGYQSRYSEYKYNPDEVHGDFKNSLNFWHLGRIFGNRPLLNGDFMKAHPDKRVFAVESQDVDSFLLDIYNDVTAVRCLPKYGTPTL